MWLDKVVDHILQIHHHDISHIIDSSHNVTLYSSHREVGSAALRLFSLNLGRPLWPCPPAEYIIEALQLLSLDLKNASLPVIFALEACLPLHCVGFQTSLVTDSTQKPYGGAPFDTPGEFSTANQHQPPWGKMLSVCLSHQVTPAFKSSQLRDQQWKYRVLITGPPVTSQVSCNANRVRKIKA